MSKKKKICDKEHLAQGGHSLGEDVAYKEPEPSCDQCEQYKAGWQRAQADYQNLQKEISESRAEWIRMSEIQNLEDYIPVFDNFKKAFAVDQGKMSKEQEGWVKGIEFIMKQFEKVLKDHGVEEIKTVGEIFDPTKHESVGEEIGTDLKEGEIVKEIESGYRKDSKIIKRGKGNYC